MSKCLLEEGICTNQEDALSLATTKFQDCIKDGINIASFREYFEEEGLDITDMLPDESDYDYNLSNLLNDKQTIKVIFKSKLTCFALAGLSLVNLYWSIKQFKEIHLNFKEKIEKIKSYKSRLKKIKTNFEDHTKELIIFDNDDYNKFINNVKKVRDNVQNDKNMLEVLINDLQTEIKSSSTQRNIEIAGLIGSVALTCAGGVGALVTKGIPQIVYGFSTLGNLCCTGMHSINLDDCLNYIRDLEKILKQAKDLNNAIIKFIDELILKLEKKKLEFPDFYKNVKEIRKIQNKQKLNFKNQK